MRDTLIIVPAYNEADNIASALESLLAQKLAADVLVVNDGSRDATEKIARTYPIEVISHPCNMGYGTALQTGYKYALRKHYRYVVQYDADGQHNPSDVQTLIAAIGSSGADLAIGSRFSGDTGFDPGALKSIAIHWFRLLIYLFTRQHISDPTSGLRALGRTLIVHYANSIRFPNDFPDADFVIDVLMHHAKVVEVPIGNRQRAGGHSMHAGWKPLVYMGKVTLSTVGVVLNNLVGKRGMTI